MTEGLMARKLAAKKLLRELLNTPLNNRDELRISDVLKAIKHNTELLDGNL